MIGDSDGQPAGGVAIWHVELAVAAILAGIGVIVIADSLRVGVGWAADGPRPGFFPLLVGAFLLASASFTALANLRPLRRNAGSFVSRPAVRSVLAIFLPAVAFVVAVGWLGLYLAAALLLAFFMRLHGGFGWLRVVGFAAALGVVLFIVFEAWFLIPLPKGPLEAALGF